MRFFHIRTSKSGPNMVCFVHFELRMYFAPQRRAIFPHPNFQKRSENRVCFVHFDLNMCFAAERCAIFHVTKAAFAAGVSSALAGKEGMP